MQPGRRTATATALVLAAATAWAPVAAPAPAAMEASRGTLRQDEGVVLFLGDSLAAGLGVPPEAAFPARVEERIEARGWDWRVVNAGVSGDTSSGGLARLDWLLRQPVDVLVLELGANDGLRGLDPGTTRENLRRIIRRTRERRPGADILLAGMQLPPNLGEEHTGAFRRLFPELAAAEDVHLIPFLLEGVAGRPELNLPDGIHPNARGHRIVAGNVWAILEPILARRSAAGGGPQASPAAVEATRRR